MRAGFEQHDTDYKTASPVIYISISYQLLLFCLSSGCFKLQSQVFKDVQDSAGLTIVSHRQVNSEVKHESNCCVVLVDGSISSCDVR